MKISHTAFGKTRDVEAEFHNMEPGLDYDDVLWVERSEDYYALMSPQLRDKRVAIVTRDNWLRAGRDEIVLEGNKRWGLD